MLRESFLERSFASQGQLGQLRDSLKGREPAWAVTVKAITCAITLLI